MGKKYFVDFFICMFLCLYIYTFVCFVCFLFVYLCVLYVMNIHVCVVFHMFVCFVVYNCVALYVACLYNFSTRSCEKQSSFLMESRLSAEPRSRVSGVLQACHPMLSSEWAGSTYLEGVTQKAAMPTPDQWASRKRVFFEHSAQKGWKQ